MDLRFVRLDLDLRFDRWVNAKRKGGKADERAQRRKRGSKELSWPMQFPTTPIWLPHKGKAGVFLTPLRVRRRPVEARASAIPPEADPSSGGKAWRLG